MSAVRALVCADVGPQSGLGHFHRCVALGAALRDIGVACAFVVDGDGPRGRVVKHGFRPVAAGGRPAGIGGVLAALTPSVRRGDWDVVVVDGYGVDDGDLSALRTAGAFVVYVDDLCRQSFSAHVVVNAGVTAATLPYRSTSGDTRFLVGPEHTLLRSEFSALVPRVVRPAARHVLIALGGADPLNLMPRLVRSLDGGVDNAEMTVVAGPFFSDLATLRASATQCRTRVRIVEAPEGMKDLMQEADLAVSAGGQTLYELAATGTPAVAMAVADNQIETVRGMARYGAAQAIEWTSIDDIVAAVPPAVAALAASPAIRGAMSVAGQRLIDGRGAARVASTLMSLFVASRQGNRDALLH